jgi:hypothetical protein
MKTKATVPADFTVGQMGSPSFNSRSRRVKKLFPEAVVLCAIIMVVSYSFAQTWTQTSGSIFGPYSMTESADGRVIMAIGSGCPVVSTNSGVTWVTNTAFSGGMAVASSADGTKMVGSFYLNLNGNTTYIVSVSTNSGNTWTQTGLPQVRFSSFASSADGVKLAAVMYNGLIYTSTNSGTTWLVNDVPTKTWHSIASSSDGTRLAAIAYNYPIYTSTNSGLTWTPTSAPSNFWSSIASSADGIHLIATAYSDTYISTNSGSSWTKCSTAGGHSVASSADGSKLIVCGAQIYTSTDFGTSWASTNIPGKQWYSAASSADGGELLAGENNGVWICQVTPSPRLKIAPSNNNLALSWIVPSTNFVLQQSSDLGSWTDMTNMPVLNLTNLQNEVVLSPPGSNAFYRLKTP